MFAQTGGRVIQPRPTPVNPTLDSTTIGNERQDNQRRQKEPVIKETEQESAVKEAKQEPIIKEAKQEPIIKEVKQEVRPSGRKLKPPIEKMEVTPTLPEAPAVLVAEDEEVKKAYKDALSSFYSAIALENQSAKEIHEYNKWVFENRKSIFEWQQFSGKVIFCVVNFLVLTGVAFSGIQFFIAMRQLTKRKRISKTTNVEENEILPTTLKASISGIEVSSSILGVIVLIVSFLFFYLYLVYVYPIVFVSE
jgi:large-conductance mechanosensitive channel